ncbi:ABC transporter substrate-binding protein [Oribacterium sp. oral taxon 102]|uniref:ABC transporter substrate-binding protein n=1 Tax=Oribacterium sp. oral taxon 102 TaxID=671214 RepID=UPI0015BFCC3C|nr:ABC transporter substrate-binding protein [Oribacterium sp. oral taxon 102]
MKKSRKLAAALLSTMVAVSALSACGGSAKPAESAAADSSKTEKTETAAAAENMHIDVIAKGFQHQFWKAVELGTKKAAEEFKVDVTFQGPDNESAIAQQVEYLNTAIAKKPAAICLAALDTQASIPSIQSAMEAGIPIIGFDSGVPDAPEGAIKANASTNNTVAGALAADELYKLIETELKDASAPVRIGVVAQESNSQSIVSRTKGFVDRMTELCGPENVSVEGHDSLKNVKAGAKVILDVGIPAEVKDVDAAAVASSILEKSDLIAIYGSNEFAANAIITANEGLDKLGEGKVVAVGFDAGKKLLDAVRNKTFAGAVTQDPVQIGYQAVKLAVEAAGGKTVEDVDTGAKWYNADNMEAEDIKPCLYE